MDKFEGQNFDLNETELEAVEAQLREGLQHVPAPAGFSDRVMARVAQREAARQQAAARKSTFRGLHRHVGIWTSIAALLALTVGGDVMYTRHQRQEREAAQVQAQLDLAMELTGHALDQVQGNLDKSPVGQLLNSLDK